MVAMAEFRMSKILFKHSLLQTIIFIEKLIKTSIMLKIVMEIGFHRTKLHDPARRTVKRQQKYIDVLY